MWTTKHPPIAQAKMCKPKEEGGLGFRDLETWNLALLARVLWQIQEKQNTLQIKWIHHTYLRQVDLWKWQAKHIDSSLIKKFLQIRDNILAIVGTLEIARQQLIAWFGPGSKGIKKANDYFKGASIRKEWAGIIWKAYQQSSHVFTLWMLVQRKLPT